MTLDPSESINNMGNLRIDVLDAIDLPSADRNGYSDPYCKFDLNGKDVFKTKVQKKTLQPVWNEFFEIPIASRTAAKFVCNVYDWDFGEKADFLGATDISLDTLTPFQAQEIKLALDGKSGSVRLRLLFRPDYVTRSRQGSSTFSGTFAAPGKIVTGVAGAPIKGVGFAAHGVGKGASFIKHGFRGKKKDEDTNGSVSIDPDDVPVANSDGFAPGPHHSSGLPSAPMEAAATSTTPPGTSIGPSPHSRTKSFGASSMHSTSAVGSSAPTGTATFTILSATGYPPSSSVMVYIRQLGAKPKVIHKTDHIKSPSGIVYFVDKKESFRCACAADTQFQIQIKGHNTFGSDDDLGEGLFFVDESGAGTERSVKAGSGAVVIRSSFAVASVEGNGNGGGGSGAPADNSPKPNVFRKSLLSKRENGRTNRDITPTPER